MVPVVQEEPVRAEKHRAEKHPGDTVVPVDLVDLGILDVLDRDIDLEVLVRERSHLAGTAEDRYAVPVGRPAGIAVQEEDLVRAGSHLADKLVPGLRGMAPYVLEAPRTATAVLGDRGSDLTQLVALVRVTTPAAPGQRQTVFVAAAVAAGVVVAVAAVFVAEAAVAAVVVEPVDPAVAAAAAAGGAAVVELVA